MIYILSTNHFFYFASNCLRGFIYVSNSFLKKYFLTVMSQLKKSFSYESQLDNLSATYDSRKKKFEKTQHLLSDEDKAFEKFLFSLEQDAFSVNKSVDSKGLVTFNFDDLASQVLVDMHPNMEFSDLSETHEGSNLSASERKHVCGHADCNKSYTSSHGLKYHLLHGHSKDKENVYKPFVCTVPKCTKAYRNSNGLKYHMANVHPKEK